MKSWWQSPVNYYIHIIFSTKHHEALIHQQIENDLYGYLSGICNKLDCPVITIGGYTDHPIERVNKRKLRAKDSVNTVWWFSKTDFPKSDVRKVLTPPSDLMKKLIENQESFYTPKKRPSGHDISDAFGKDNGGAIPSNLLSIPNTDSNSSLRLSVMMITACI